MTLTVETVVETLRAHADEYRRRRITHVSVFGSVARGEATAESDVDIVVDYDIENPPSLIDIIALENRSSEILGYPVDLMTRAELKPRVARNAERDMVHAF